MKKVLIPFSVLVIVLFLTQCGPAAEDRNVMYANAKRVRDSIAKDIDEALAKGAIPGTATLATAPADTAKAAK